MNTQRIWWRRPGFVALGAVILLINLVVDWWVFKPQSLPMFVAIEAVVYGGIIWLAGLSLIDQCEGGKVNEGKRLLSPATPSTKF
jgi:hypothetical protein